MLQGPLPAAAPIVFLVYAILMPFFWSSSIVPPFSVYAAVAAQAARFPGGPQPLNFLAIWFTHLGSDVSRNSLAICFTHLVLTFVNHVAHVLTWVPTFLATHSRVHCVSAGVTREILGTTSAVRGSKAISKLNQECATLSKDLTPLVTACVVLMLATAASGVRPPSWIATL